MSKVRFQDIVKQKDGFLRGPFGGDLKKDIFVEKSCDTYKVYEQGVVLNNDESIGRYYISNDYFKKKMYRFEVKPKDFLVSCSGVNYGAIHQLSENIEKGVINQALLRIRLDSEKVDDNYFYYLFKALIVNMIVGKKGDSTIPNFPPLSVIKALEFELPEKDYQIQIGRLLSHLDNKIELNNRINAELEAMAKTLYDYWFVQFDFPDDSPQGQGKPYKTSGGKMVYNPTLKREIPEGWELVPIEYFADVIDPHPSHRAPREVEIGFPFAGIGDIDEAGNISTSKARQIDEEFVLKQERDYEIGEYSLGYGRVGTVGKVVRLKKQKFRYALSPTLSVINPKKPEYAGYVYTVVKSDEFYKHVIKNTSGTTRPAVGIQLLRKIPVLKPGSAHNNMFEKYEEITKELFEKSSIANQENQNLIELRDWLLPMLMNGQVTVNSVTQPTAKEA